METEIDIGMGNTMRAANQFQAEPVSSTRTAVVVIVTEPSSAAKDDLRASRNTASATTPISTGKITRTRVGVNAFPEANGTSSTPSRIH